MKKLSALIIILFMIGMAAYGQTTATGAKGAAAVVGAASAVASTDMGPGLESLKANLQEDYTVVVGNTLKGVSASVYGDYRYWTIVYLTNKEIISNPERIEPNTAFKIYKLPFDPKLPNDISKALIAETYMQTYARYVELGSDWVDARRWVLLEATRFAPTLFTKFEARIDASDVAWYKAR